MVGRKIQSSGGKNVGLVVGGKKGNSFSNWKQATASLSRGFKRYASQRLHQAKRNFYFVSFKLAIFFYYILSPDKLLINQSHYRGTTYILF